MSTPATVSSNGLSLAYETFGDPAHPTVLLVMGLATQMPAWEDGFCQELVDRGHHVVRFDNRDVGLSTHLSQLPAGRPVSAFFGRQEPPYLVADMADDAAGLVEALDLAPVHAVGISMGGCIAQSLALRRPDLVASLTSISSSTGSRRVGHPNLATAYRLLTRPTVATREEAIALKLTVYRQQASPAYPLRLEEMREIAGLSWDRSYDPDGSARQFAAILGSPDRTAELRGLDVPALVVHGLSDPLINASGGRATAAAIPDAKLVTFAGMGHEIPQPLWAPIADGIAEVARAGEERRAHRTA